MFEQAYAALIDVFQWQSLVAMLGGTILGIILGAIPGISGTMGIALAIPFTYGMHPLAALGLLAGIHNGTSQGSAIPAVLLKIPGSPGSFVTVWDGYPMARQGHAGAAIQLAAVSSAVGGMISALFLLALAPPLASAALAFGPPEIFWVTVFGLVAVSSLLGNDRLKGAISACLGLLIGAVGIDNVTGYERFTFGLMNLRSGIPEAVVMVGLFSLPVAWIMAGRVRSDMGEKIVIATTRGVWKVRQVWRTWVRSSLIGVALGIIPGSAIGCFLAYATAKKASKSPETFGKGNPEGIAAAESVNNADNAAAMIPALTLGVPGSNIAALMLGALLIQGFQPGPMLFRDASNIVYAYTWQMFITSALLIFFGGTLASRIFSKVLWVPQSLLIPFIVCLVMAGSLSLQNNYFHVYMAFLFGLVGYFMQKFGFPLAPIVIGLVLGVMSEFNLRISLVMSNGDPLILLTRPVCLIIAGATLALLLSPLIRKYAAYAFARFKAG